MKTALTILLFCIALCGFAQKASQYDNIRLTTANEYRKAEPQVILAADYIVSTPIEKENTNRINAISFLMKWMSGTSDYSFVMNETIQKVTGGDRALMGVYFACLAKYALEKGKNADREEVKYHSYLLFAAYCENPDNNYKPRGEVKKLVEAKNQNKLKEYLDAIPK